MHPYHNYLSILTDCSILRRCIINQPALIITPSSLLHDLLYKIIDLLCKVVFRAVMAGKFKIEVFFIPCQT